MGLFSKEPAEKKAYWKAFDAMLSKPNPKTFAAVEEASKAWPSGWQGYLFIALCYDLASNKMPFDPEKADGYHKLAKEAGKRDQSEWLECFYEAFEKEAGNFRMEGEYFPRVQYIRKAGVAMLLNYDSDKNDVVINVRSKNDWIFWHILFSGIDTGPTGLFKKASDEQFQCWRHASPFRKYLTAYSGLNMDEKTRVNDANEMINGWKEFANTNKAEITPDTKDMYGYVFGYSLMIGGGPYQILNGASGFHKNLRVDGWIKLWRTASLGCMPALHMLADFFDSEFSEEIYYAYSQVYSSGRQEREEIFPQLMALLEMSAEKGDQEARRLIDTLAK